MRLCNSANMAVQKEVMNGVCILFVQHICMRTCPLSKYVPCNNDSTSADIMKFDTTMHAVCVTYTACIGMYTS